MSENTIYVLPLNFCTCPYTVHVHVPVILTVQRSSMIQLLDLRLPWKSFLACRKDIPLAMSVAMENLWPSVYSSEALRHAVASSVEEVEQATGRRDEYSAIVIG